MLFEKPRTKTIDIWPNEGQFMTITHSWAGMMRIDVTSEGGALRISMTCYPIYNRVEYIRHSDFWYLKWCRLTVGYTDT